MTFIPDRTLDHLRKVVDMPDLGGTKYEVIDYVARGGMGAVYLARDVELDREVALKVLDVGDAHGGLAERMTREARILARLEHPGVVPVHDVGTLADGRVFYTMKFVRGRRLDEYVRDENPDLADVLRVFARICEAVAFAHSHGVIHRDLKPQNIMVGSFGEVLVMDWGVAKLLDDARASQPARESDGDAAAPTVADTEAHARSGGVDTAAATVGIAGADTHAGTVLGTPGYMAPEQARGDVHAVDRRADVYALGAILRELVERALGRGNAPKRLRAIVGKAMAPRPAERYQAVEVLGRDTARFAAGMSVSAYEEGVLEKAWRVAVRHKTPIALILAYLLMRILLFFFSRS